MDSWFTTNEKVPKVKTQKEVIAACNSESYQSWKKNNPELQKRYNKAGTLARLDNKDYRDKYNQQNRIHMAGYRTVSKKVAVDAGTRDKHLSKDGVALVKHHYVAWKKTHLTMRGFYPKLCAENQECLKGYDARRLGRLCENHKFSSLSEDYDSGDQEGEDEGESEDEQMDDKSGNLPVVVRDGT